MNTDLCRWRRFGCKNDASGRDRCSRVSSGGLWRLCGAFNMLLEAHGFCTTVNTDLCCWRRFGCKNDASGRDRCSRVGSGGFWSLVPAPGASSKLLKAPRGSWVLHHREHRSCMQKRRQRQRSVFTGRFRRPLEALRSLLEAPGGSWVLHHREHRSLPLASFWMQKRRQRQRSVFTGKFRRPLEALRSL